MNERIQELAEQAAQEVRVAHNNAYWRMQNEIAEDEAWKEKFAELIVRECAGVVAKDMDYHANWCGDKILKHFGVEE